MAAPYPAHGTVPWDEALKAYLDDPENWDAIVAMLVLDTGGVGPLTNAAVAAVAGGGDPNAAVYGINVKNPTYGAVGDGTANDTTEIQAAIDAAGSVAGGATVFFPPGIYKISAPLVVPSGVYLLGCGWGNTIIRAAAASVMDAMITTSVVQLNWTMTITDIQLDGNRTNGAAVDNGILWFGASDSTIQRVRVVQVAGNGINLTGSSLPLLGTANKLLGINIRGCDGIGILNDVFTTDTMIEACDVGQCDGQAFYLAGSNSSLVGSIGWGSLTGLSVDTSGILTRVVGCRFDYNSLAGLYVVGDDVQISGTLVHSNSAAATGVHPGIEIGDGAGRVVIVGTRSLGQAIPGATDQSYGLKLGAGRTAPATIVGCDFTGNQDGEIDGLDTAGGDVLGVSDTDLFAILSDGGSASRGEIEGIIQFFINDKLKTATAVLDFGSITSWSSSELLIDVPGAVVGDSVYIGAPQAIEAGLSWNGYVSGPDEVLVRVFNNTGSGIDPASATWRATVSH